LSLPNMPTTPRQSSTTATASGPSLAAARALLKPRLTLDALMAKLVTARERTNVQQHLDTLRGAGSDAHAKLWERIATALFTLPADATEAQVGAVEELVALAALKWRQK